MKRILIVEDDKDISKALTIRLKAANYQVDSAEDVVQGVNHIVRNPPDLILLDISIQLGMVFYWPNESKVCQELVIFPLFFLLPTKCPNYVPKQLR